MVWTMTNTQTTEHQHQDTATGWFCSDCFMLLVNGETPPEMDEEQTAAWLESLDDDDEVTPGFGADEHDEDCPNHGEWIGADCSCETMEFSWRVCDSCRTGLGGTRHAVTYWI